ncbi:hypothetical protein BDR06DRAFT_1002524 [Suillus hirtellus]|nr:hypothetical protein BDR06DRAFT_1002524 [Suillus hirtellus]
MRDTSEKEGWVLRPNSRCRAREEAIATFDKAVEFIVPGPLFLQHSRGRSCNVSEPAQPDPTPKQPISPITPSPEESVKEESSDDFEAIDNPRSHLPRVFLHMPNQLPFIANLSALSALTDLEDTPLKVSISPARENMPATKELLKIKNKVFKTPCMPNSIPGGTIVSNIPLIYMQQVPVTQKTPMPTTSQSLIMSAVQTRMLICRMADAPKFDGTMDNLADFINAYKQLADEVGLQGLDCIKGIIQYLKCDNHELWGGMPKVQVSNYDALLDEVKVMYPGWDGKRCHMLADLQAIVRDYANKPMLSYQELSSHLCTFKKIVQLLLVEDHIGKAEHNCIFMEGIPKDAQVLICTRLMIKFLDHYPQDPYPFMNIFAAGQFVLPANVPAPSAMASAPKAAPLTNLIAATTPSQAQA